MGLQYHLERVQEVRTEPGGAPRGRMQGAASAEYWMYSSERRRGRRPRAARTAMWRTS
jgi:hypothetical protein